ncbi:MAG: hypothetical protein J6K69_07165 [Candidatus Methanomethylophilaceae archaeon]|nr:hypothetical protein [Candidatus Methanomethylophilaceae archaeon]
MKCQYCTRQAEHEVEIGMTFRLCDQCARVFREGFERGRLWESINRRKVGRNLRHRGELRCR